MNIPSERQKASIEIVAEWIWICLASEDKARPKDDIRADLYRLAEQAQDVGDNLPCSDGLDESGHIICTKGCDHKHDTSCKLSCYDPRKEVK